MDSSSGRIQAFDSTETAKKEGFDTPLTKKEADLLASYPPNMRWRVLKDIRRAALDADMQRLKMHPAAKLEGQSESERRMNRNIAKSTRRARRQRG